MTRYARAKGSKASNERLPDEATPWHIMKQQLDEKKNKEPLEKKKSAKELLNNEENILDSNTNGNINHNWAEFDDNNSKCNTRKCKNSKSNKSSINLTKDCQNDDTIAFKSNNNTGKLQEVESTKSETTDSKTSKFSKKKKLNINNSHSSSNEIRNEACSNFTVLSKRQKRNQKRKLEGSNDNSKRFRQDISGKNPYSEIKKKKIKKEGEYKRRKPDVGVTKIMINNVEVEIVKYDGFPVKKEDADRLAELKQQLIIKGIPKSEVDMAMKLERRKAEKNLQRAKKVVCFHCRKSGHNLSDCPELGREETCTGICFKCGSTEHTHFECKVYKDSTYGYAKCFICREQGHIAMQCPDNPKGIYPHGGCCKICGSVTHLKKDCPDLVKTKEDSTFTLEKMNDSAIESLREDVKEKDESNKPHKNKIIKF